MSIEILQGDCIDSLKKLEDQYSIIKGLEDLSSTTDGLMMVKTANGVLVQPNNHQEVKDALDYLDKIREVNSKADVR